MITDILIEPMNREFDVAEIERLLGGIAFTVRDERVPNEFMMFDQARAARRAIGFRRENLTRFPTNAILILVNPHRIDIAYRAAELEPARKFVIELRSKYDLRFLDETFADLTASVDDNLEYLFGPSAS